MSLLYETSVRRSRDTGGMTPLADDAGRLAEVRAAVASGAWDVDRLDDLQSHCRAELLTLQDELQQLLGDLRREAARLSGSRRGEAARLAA